MGDPVRAAATDAFWTQTAREQPRIGSTILYTARALAWEYATWRDQPRLVPTVGVGLIIRRPWVRVPPAPPAVIRYILCLLVDRFGCQAAAQRQPPVDFRDLRPYAIKSAADRKHPLSSSTVCPLPLILRPAYCMDLARVEEPASIRARLVSVESGDRFGYICPAGSGWGPGSGWPTGPAACLFQSRQMSRCSGIHLGMSRRPGMNGTNSSSRVAAPVI